MPLFPGHARHAPPSSPPHPISHLPWILSGLDLSRFYSCRLPQQSRTCTLHTKPSARAILTRKKKDPTSSLPPTPFLPSACHQTGAIPPTPVLFANASRQDPSRTSPVPNCLLRATNPDKSSSVIRTARSVNLVLGFPRSVLRHSYLARRP